MGSVCHRPAADNYLLKLVNRRAQIQYLTYWFFCVTIIPMRSTQTYPSTQVETPENEPNWELLEEMVDYLNNGRGKLFGSDHILLMAYLDKQTLDHCSHSFQRRFWERMVAIDPEEAINYYWKYVHLPFGRDLLKKAALADPGYAIERIDHDPEDLDLQRLYRFLLRELGHERIMEIRMSRESKILRWLTKWLFCDEEAKKNEQQSIDLKTT